MAFRYWGLWWPYSFHYMFSSSVHATFSLFYFVFPPTSLPSPSPLRTCKNPSSRIIFPQIRIYPYIIISTVYIEWRYIIILLFPFPFVTRNLVILFYAHLVYWWFDSVAEHTIVCNDYLLSFSQVKDT